MSKQKKQQSEDAPAVVQASDSPKHRNIKKPFIISVIVVILVAGGVIAFMQFTTTPPTSKTVAEKTGDTFVTNMKEKKLSAVRDQFTDEAKKAITDEELAALDKESGGYLQGALKKVKAENASGRTAAGQQLVEYEATDTSGQKYHLTLTLVQEHGTWKILNFSKTFYR